MLGKLRNCKLIPSQCISKSAFISVKIKIYCIQLPLAQWHYIIRLETKKETSGSMTSIDKRSNFQNRP